MEEKTLTPDTGTVNATQEQQDTPSQFGNTILNELHRPRPFADTAAIIQFCVNVGILPDDYGTQIITKRQPPYVPLQAQQAQPTQKAGD